MLSLPSKVGVIKIDKIESIEFENVSFKFDEEIIKGISFYLKKGDFIRVHGRNGSGKSTLISLMLNYYLPTGGIIKINGISLKKIDNDNYVDKILFLDQNEVLLAEPIIDYLSIITKSTDRKEIENLLSKFNMWDDEVQKNEYVLDPNGKNISGGQAKKLLLTKLLLKLSNADLIIIDEITANLDFESKKKYTEIKNGIINSQKKIIVEISHDTVENDSLSKIINL